MNIKSLKQLFRITANPVHLINYLFTKGLVKRNRTCCKRNCRRRMFIIRDNSRQENFIFRCPKCRMTQSIRKGSFFEEARLSVKDVLHVTFCWAAKVPVRSASAITGVHEKSVSQWYIFLKELCSKDLLNNPNYVFGGPGVVVQIDESLVAKRKYNVGRDVEQQWVFGLYDTSTKLGHVQLVEDRTAQTLLPIIQRFIRAGSTIFSDRWAAYNQLTNLGYLHTTVNHSENFVDPATGTCTNAIEAYWSRVKRNIRLHWLSDRDQLPLRIDEFLWRDRLTNKKYIHAFEEMLRLMAQY